MMRQLPFLDSREAMRHLCLGENLGKTLVNVNATPLYCILRWKRRKAMKIRDLQLFCYAAEMCPNAVSPGLSIRWFLVRVPSPSLKRKEPQVIDLRLLSFSDFIATERISQHFTKTGRFEPLQGGGRRRVARCRGPVCSTARRHDAKEKGSRSGSLRHLWRTEAHDASPASSCVSADAFADSSLAASFFTGGQSLAAIAACNFCSSRSVADST